MVIRKPSVGTTVHHIVTNEAADRERHPLACHAAIITEITDMEAVGADGTSYAEHPMPDPMPELHTRWWVSLATIHPDGTTTASHDVAGSASTAGWWHWPEECRMPSLVDWKSPEERQNGTPEQA